MTTLTGHHHEWGLVDRDDNDDRTRTLEVCACGAERFGCLAKRLDSDGGAAWGPPGEQWYRVDDDRRL